MTTLLGCIADDFTGATDLAGLLARSGIKVSLRMGIPDEEPEDTAAIEVIALKCRTAPVEEAVAECRAALSWLRKAGATRFFWKYCSTFDSTDKGNIGPVAEALMDDIGATQTIYCPAFPENGRSIFMGSLFVGEQPLAESPMKDHPLTPMRDSNLMRLLAPQVSKPVALANRLVVEKGAEALQHRLAELEKEGAAHVVVDAVANDDLYTIAEACKHLPLMTGGSAIAMPLPDLYRQQNLLAADSPKTLVPELAESGIVLSGSCSAMTRAQVSHYCQSAPSYRINPLELAEHGTAPILDWLGKQDLSQLPIIYATAEPDDVRAVQNQLGVEKAGEMVEDTLATLAIAARELGAQRFIVAGGETSGAVTKALGISKLDVSAEIAPGVPWSFCQSDGKAIALTLKSGNFGAEHFFSDAQSKLREIVGI